MPNQSKRDEQRERIEKPKPKETPPPAPPPKNDTSIGGTLDKIKERQKLLDEI